MIQNLFSIPSFFNIKFMFKHIFYAVLLFISATTTQCSKTTVDPNGLPPETQTGAGTFACKINGVVWRFKDPNYEFLSTKPVTSWIFDPNDRKGYLRISGLYYSTSGSVENNLIIGADSLTEKKVRITNGDPYGFGFVYDNYSNSTSKCQTITSQRIYDTTSMFFSNCGLVLTKLDLNAKIISGTFYGTVKQSGCDTLKITDGRFDLKYQ